MKKLWITYAWKDNEGGDFDYLVQELEKKEIEVIYDKRALIPGFHLWEQIGKLISEEKIDGWAYLITPNSLKSKPCIEEYELAINRYISNSNNIPLIGIMHGVSIKDVPPLLKTRLCVNSEDHNFIESILSSINNTRPSISIEEKSKFIYSIRNNWQNNPNLIAIEVNPRFGSIQHWAFNLAIGIELKDYGVGPKNGSSLSSVLHDVWQFETEYEGKKKIGIGVGDLISQNNCAFIILEKQNFILGFGPTRGPNTNPEYFEYVKFTF